MRRPRPVVLAAGAFAGVLGTLGSGCGSSSPSAAPPPAAAVVSIKNIAFHPKSITVHPGDVVAWKFDDGGIAHNVTGDGWHSPDGTGGYYTHTFAASGTYAYRCTIHIGMDGVVVVTP